MSKSIRVHIPNPCHENWEKMSIAEKGRFCAACQKQVVDFTAMPNAEVYEYFKMSAGQSVCGRFKKEQLSRPLHAAKRKLPWARYVLQTSVPLLLVACKGYTQGEVKTEQVSNCCYPVESGLLLRNNIQQPVADSELVAVKGRLLDQEGLPIVQASVSERRSGKQTLSDADGYFELRLSKNQVAELEAQSVGYELMIISAFITADTDLGKQQMIGQIMGDTLIMAGAVAVEYQEPVDKVDSFFRKLLTKDLFKLYPNPIHSGESLQIDLLRKAEGLKEIRVINFAGQVSFRFNPASENRGQQLRISLPSLPRGSYVVQLSYDDPSLNASQKLIVQ